MKFLQSPNKNLDGCKFEYIQYVQEKSTRRSCTVPMAPPNNNDVRISVMDWLKDDSVMLWHLVEHSFCTFNCIGWELLTLTIKALWAFDSCYLIRSLVLWCWCDILYINKSPTLISVGHLLVVLINMGHFWSWFS